jgi:hypothetical protein
MKARYFGLWLVSVMAALVAGSSGGWMVSWLAGNTANVEIECYKYYGRQETVHHRCEGGWQRTQPVSDGSTRFVVSGPVVGIPIRSNAKLSNPDQRNDFGYRLEPDSYPGTVFATLTDDAAVAVPTSARIVGPLGVLVLIACGFGLILLRRRESTLRHSSQEEAS